MLRFLPCHQPRTLWGLPWGTTAHDAPRRKILFSETFYQHAVRLIGCRCKGRPARCSVFPGSGMKGHPTPVGGGVIGPASPVAWGAHRWARPNPLSQSQAHLPLVTTGGGGPLPLPFPMYGAFPLPTGATTGGGGGGDRGGGGPKSAASACPAVRRAGHRRSTSQHYRNCGGRRSTAGRSPH